MKYVIAALTILVFGGALAQDSPRGRVHIDLRETMSGNYERSNISWACTQIAHAAIYAHEHGKLSDVMNESAKIKQTGSSDDPFFKDLIKNFQLNPSDDFLFSALFISQINLTYLEEQKGPYRNEVSSVYTSYLSASCASVAKFLSSP